MIRTSVRSVPKATALFQNANGILIPAHGP
jgi:hypothetical protein